MSWCLLVGGTKGIGKAVALELAGAGHDLVLVYAHDESAAQVAQREISADGTRVVLLRADITNDDAVETISARLESEDWTLGAVIICAGLTSRVSFEALTRKDWQRVQTANVEFPVFLIQRLLPRLSTGASVILTGSAMAKHPHSVSLAYGVTKSAVHALGRNLIKFLSPMGVRVNVIVPGFVESDWHATKLEGVRESIESKIALHRFADPSEIAPLYRMALENGYLNGSIISIDGGYGYE